jgi:tetratricopeptide (TPR) repeat protein
MSFFNGLYPWETLMLVAGCLFFLVLLVALIVFVIRNKSITALLPFFVLTIVMIGFPSYQSIQITKDGVTLQKDVDQLKANPTDTALRETVSTQVAKLAARPIQNAGLVTTIASAQVALGDTQSAQTNLDKALALSPQLPAALDLKKRLEIDSNLQKLSSAVEQNPNDQAAKDQLSTVVSQASSMQIASPVTMTNLAKAHVLLGNPAQAKVIVDKALKIDPKFAPALTLKQKITPP